jgi:hypothetical protein
MILQIAVAGIFLVPQRVGNRVGIRADQPHPHAPGPECAQSGTQPVCRDPAGFLRDAIQQCGDISAADGLRFMMVERVSVLL